ncbi:MAG: UvrD-helicase domain-containing protein [candidate division Zixibacteria bacterium]|nr:UvrD-helicase domain-containing protein [candidate division Zixibacteria bacterium]
MSNRLLKDLNNAQLAAVTATEGPLLVIAGAGSGKTRVLTRRLAYILHQRLARPYEILAVTFTNKAAGEMKNRVAELLGGEIPEMHVATFHSFCARLLRYEAKHIGFDGNYTIFDDMDSVALVKNCIKELGFTEKQFPARAQRRKISDAKNHLINAEKFAERAAGYFETRTAEIYTRYQNHLRKFNSMDFDDLLFNAVVLLRDVTEIGEKYRLRFKYLLVDEYQDTNHVQYLLLKYLLGEHNNICVVGDEDQSIYGWRGADINNILNFEKDFPGAKVIKLERNYRSTALILRAASSVIKNNAQRKEKTLWTDVEGGESVKLLMVDSAEEEAVRVIETIDYNHNGHDLKETVILYRTNAQSRPFEEQLRRQNIPYQIVGGISFYERKEIKDLTAYLRLIANIKDDISFERVINYPKRGIGGKTVEEIKILALRENTSMYEVVLKGDTFPELAVKYKRLEPFIALIEKYREKKETLAVDILTQDLVEELQLVNVLREEDEATGQMRLENIEAFIEGTAEFARTSDEPFLDNYLAEISLFTGIDQYREIEDKLTMMTIHTAKGLEFDNVYIVGLEEGLFPLQRAMTEPGELEEERRLFYVAATRARKRLFLACATTRFRFGEVESLPSRFIREIDEDLLEVRDLRTRRVYAPEHTVATGPEIKMPRGVHYEYEEDEIMRTGRIVQHPTFGRGKIVKVEGMGESLRLEVMFTGVGIKKIMAKYARLKIIG